MPIFGVAAGTAGVITSVPRDTLPAVVSIAGFKSAHVAITGVGFGQDANAQFVHSLARKIYIYAFGERMGNIEVSGVAFYRPCGGADASSIVSVLRYYVQNSVSVKNTPTSVSLAGANIAGFVRGIRTTFSDPSRGVIGFTIVMASMPEMWGA